MPSWQMSRFSLQNLKVDIFSKTKMCGPAEVERIDTQNDAIFEAEDTQKSPNHHS